ncbi:MAG: hypothetical protein IJR28_01255 [Ottowia sp.]|nr:hypothetical protein [Ottowia sp.]
MNWDAADTSAALRAIIQHAVAPARRARFLGFLETGKALEKGLEKWCKDLDHFERYLALDAAAPLGSAAHALEYISAHIAADAPAFAFSTLREYRRGVFVPAAALARDIAGSGCGALALMQGRGGLQCFYFGENVGENYAWTF